MKVSELMRILSVLPDDSQVCVANPRDASSPSPITNIERRYINHRVEHINKNGTRKIKIAREASDVIIVRHEKEWI